MKQVEEALAEASSQLRTLEDKGFTAGNDASFAAFREQYETLSQKVRAMQQQAQELRYGTRRGAEPTDEEVATGGNESGGEIVVGLEELQRRLAAAQERAKRLERATTDLNEHLTYVNGLGQGAQNEAGRYQTRLTELETAQKALITETATLAAGAAEKEEAAAKAADTAARAFGQAQRAADNWINAARTLRREHDPHQQERPAASRRAGRLF